MPAKIRARDIAAGRFYRRDENDFVRYVVAVVGFDAHYADRFGKGRCTLACLAAWADRIDPAPPEAELIHGVPGTSHKLAGHEGDPSADADYWRLDDRDRTELARGSVRMIEAVRDRMLRLYGDAGDRASQRYFDAVRFCQALEAMPIRFVKQCLAEQFGPDFHAVTITCQEGPRDSTREIVLDVEYARKPYRVRLALAPFPWPAASVEARGIREATLEAIVDALVAAGWRTFQERLDGNFDIVWEGAPTSPLPKGTVAFG